jgi:hypothetical protein
MHFHPCEDTSICEFLRHDRYHSNSGIDRRTGQIARLSAPEGRRSSVRAGFDGPIGRIPAVVSFQEVKLRGLVHVVDDDASFRTAIERRLKFAGYDLATYASAQELLDHLPDNGKPGCMLLDVQILGVAYSRIPDVAAEMGSPTLRRGTHEGRLRATTGLDKDLSCV